MDGILIFALFLLFFVFIVGGVFYYYYVIRKGNSTSGLQAGDFWSEKSLVNTLRKLPTPKLLQFKFDKQLPNKNPWCHKTWYAIRLVNTKTGEYGPMSDWMSSPVYAGMTKDTCTYNSVTIGTDEVTTKDIDLSNYGINLHRQVDSLFPASDGAIVGMLLPSANGFSALDAIVTPAGDNVSRCPIC